MNVSDDDSIFPCQHRVPKRLSVEVPNDRNWKQDYATELESLQELLGETLIPTASTTTLPKTLSTLSECPK